MDKQKQNLTIILFLMIITGFIIYFMYLKPEQFETTIPSTIPNTTSPMTTSPMTTVPMMSRPVTTISNICQNNQPVIPVAIISRYFGVGFNIYPVNTANNLFLIEHIPITTTGTAGGMYSISSDGNFTIKIKNINDQTQWWNMTNLIDNIDKSDYIVMKPYSKPDIALQYANGSLSIRPYINTGFEGQKFLKSNTIVSRGIPVLNNSPSSMFTTEFDPYSTSTSTMTNLSDSNDKQVSDVVNAVKTSIQQYLSKVSSSQPTGQVSASSLGNKEMPLNINLNLGNSSNGISNFENVTGATSDEDILSILNKYESQSGSDIFSSGGGGNKTFYLQSDLQNQIDTTSSGCKLQNLNDYTSNRVSTCNCKI